MFAPNISTHQLADAIHHERQADAALIHQAKSYRAAHGAADRPAQRRLTSRRLAATLAGALLTLVVAATVAANQPAAAPAGHSSTGGGLTLIR